MPPRQHTENPAEILNSPCHAQSLAAVFRALAGGHLNAGASKINRKDVLRKQYTQGVLKSCARMRGKKVTLLVRIRIKTF